ncbi:hypothetical protein [Paraburkholderia sp. RL17-373-BIF-A]|uniref:hypothetical protein n=1 Tax=Paraburkholderia sp. RL17-373-BIF-A TaxID=3031629 RepID=UPI0038BCF92C
MHTKTSPSVGLNSAIRGGAKDLILSILTFGIYAWVKSSKMDETREVAEKAIGDLCLMSQAAALVKSVDVMVEGKVLHVEERDNCNPYFLRRQELLCSGQLRFR